MMMRYAVQDETQSGQLVDVFTKLSVASSTFNVVHAFGSMVSARFRRFSKFIAAGTVAISGL
ncbi:hypothetical protein M2418_002607 [Rhizobium sp. BIGb0125]|nr:hypothetical protein [Rhizobium sp. BIGb0125]